ncbi:hypothetical protein ASG60_18285 [Methylobacterium sp. Leaf469]|nr:hypothetical protein ASG60_18285 [Methylobacterium sp. Leaf469]
MLMAEEGARVEFRQSRLPASFGATDEHATPAPQARLLPQAGHHTGLAEDITVADRSDPFGEAGRKTRGRTC